MDAKALREEFSTVHAEANAVITAAATEKRDITAEEKAANDKRFGRLDAIKKLFDEERRFAAMALEQGTATTPADPEGRAEFDASEGRQTIENGQAQRQEFAELNGKRFALDAYKKALNTYAQTGDTRQLFTVTSTTQSNAFLPKQVLQPATVRRLQNAWRGVLAASGFEPIETDTTASFSLPVADDTAVVGQAVTESATSGTTADPAWTGSISISPTLYGSKQAFFSNTMVMAQGFDIVSFVLPILQKRIQKIQESTWTTNVLTNGTIGVTCASASAVTYKELLAWEHSLPAAYRTDACFVCADTLYQTLRGLVDNNNRPIMDLDPTNVFAGKIHNRPVIVGDYMQAMGANNITGAFVSGEAIKIIDVRDARLARYSNLPQFPDQIGFEMFQNGDFGFIGNGLRVIKQGIS